MDKLDKLLVEFERKAIVRDLVAVPPQQGTLVEIPNWEHLEVKVAACKREPGDRVKIYLDWGQHGSSYVYLHDEGKTWSRKETPLN